MKNLIIGQSGGPTAVINASLCGAVAQWKRQNQGGCVYGMINGIEGLLAGRYMELSALSDEELSLLKLTPAAYLGSCRYKLPADPASEVYTELFKKLEALNIGWFLYVGGNDSMDTVDKLSRHAAAAGSEIRFIGIPKTIDNDLVMTDHTPGYGSAAKYVAATVREIVLDASVYQQKSVTIVEIMGRHAGWLTAAASLAAEKGDGPDLIYLPERDFSMDQFLDDVIAVYKRKGECLIAVSEGVHYADGTFVSEAKTSGTDGFGHAQLGGLAARLAGIVKAATGAKVRGIELSLLQRCAAHCASGRDIEESFNSGKVAVESAIAGESGKMVGFRCERENGYVCHYELFDLEKVANFEQKVPASWINAEGNNVTKDFVDYCAPLIQGDANMPFEDGLPRFAQLKRHFV